MIDLLVFIYFIDLNRSYRLIIFYRFYIDFIDFIIMFFGDFFDLLTNIAYKCLLVGPIYDTEM